MKVEAGSFKDLFGDDEKSTKKTTAAKPATLLSQENKKQASRGRPKIAGRANIKSTILRIDEGDLKAVKTLAIRQDMTMNALILEAVTEYCAKYSVKLKH